MECDDNRGLKIEMEGFGKWLADVPATATPNELRPPAAEE